MSSNKKNIADPLHQHHNINVSWHYILGVVNGSSKTLGLAKF